MTILRRDAGDAGDEEVSWAMPIRSWLWVLWVGAAALPVGACAVRTEIPGAAPPVGQGGRADWPGDERGLVFLWHDASRANQVAGLDGRPARPCRVGARGAARLYRFHDMDLAGGAFLAEDVDDRLLAACKASGRLTVEAVITPDSVKQPGRAAIVSFSGGDSSRNFALVQKGEDLVLLLRTRSDGAGASDGPVLCKLAAGEPHHVIVSYAAGTTACYLNGVEVSVSRAVRGDFGNWTPQRLVFGDEYAGGGDWAGRLEGIAVYSRFVDAAEAKRKDALYRPRLANRKPARRLILLGRLRQAAATPTVKAIHPYRRCLAVHTYEVQEVLSGRYDRRRILVAHWVILDARVVGFRRRIGRTYRLTVEPFADHPQLATERVMTTPDQLDPEMYYDVERTSAGTGPKVAGQP